MEFTVVGNANAVSHIRLAGRMDPHGTVSIRERLRAETVGRERPAVVDVSGVSFITSVGIGLLVDCAETMRRQGHAVVFVRPQGHVDEVFRKTGIYAILRCADSVEDAHTALASP